MEQKELNDKIWKVNGFVFENEEQAKLAQKEVEGIHYIQENMNIENPQMVQEIYQRIMAQELFHTPIGYAYLKELQDYLKGLPEIDAAAIPGIPVKDMGLDLDQVVGREKNGEHANKNTDENSEKQDDEAVGSDIKVTEKEKKKQQEQQETKLQKRCRILLSVNIVLIIIVIAMFAISLTSGSTTILNYETKIINKYEAWEQELDEREAALDALEKQN